MRLDLQKQSSTCHEWVSRSVTIIKLQTAYMENICTSLSFETCYTETQTINKLMFVSGVR
jgi:hypothetical protein